ncbi:uncharacterized protein LOC108902620 [Lates calcarifer]|uniref:Uncharacterized protein LOC108902620 n=1 Tax=Lates calcarifer TaxID=8187 RepID=A0AAJ7QMK6_LATCA|nr:uncharacterized protein LOC108902620 [Lates calcarifer]
MNIPAPCLRISLNRLPALLLFSPSTRSVSFDKMSFVISIVAVLMITSCVSPLEYSQRNVSCHDIKTHNGFKFSHECSTALEISAYHNETAIATVKNDIFKHLPAVIHMDSTSVVTKECRDLKLICIIRNGDKVKEIVQILKTTEENPDEPYVPWSTIICLTLGGVIGITAVLSCCYISWKKEMKNQQGPATPSGFLRYLVTCCFLRKGISQGPFCPETRETRNHAGSETQEDTNGDLRIQPRDISLIERSSAIESHQSGENEQDGTLEAVCVPSIDSKTDGETPHTHSLDHNWNDEGIQPTKNGGISAPGDNRASHHRAKNRNLRDDPGGVNYNKRKDLVRIMEGHNGCVQFDCGPEVHKTEGQPLLVNRANIQASDKTGEAVSLVNKRDFDPDQVSRCSTVPDTDVESATKMKNDKMQKY